MRSGGFSRRDDGQTRRDICILIDEKVLEILIEAEVDGGLGSISDGEAHVTVVDGKWMPGSGDTEYQGWMKVYIRQPMRLYDVLGSSSLNQNWCILKPKDNDGAFVYDGRKYSITTLKDSNHEVFLLLK